MFRPGEIWNDTDGKPIQAHGGGILFDSGIYYWYGENKTGVTRNHRVDIVGVSCYASHDLYNWHYQGLALSAVSDNLAHDLHPSKVAERPKVIYNRRTKQYVMWLHVDASDYRYARAGVAVSDRPTGPFEYLRSIRPFGKVSHDLTVFEDDSESAYLVFCADSHRNITVGQLSDDYLSTTDVFTENMGHSGPPRGREAPAVFKHEGKYFMITSGTTSWDPNEAQYAVADRILGPWTVKGNPAKGNNAHVTFNAQGTFVLPVAGKKAQYIFMADQWNKADLADSRYVWLPIAINGEELSIFWRDTWTLGS
jgi:beta-xylosidase